MALPLCRGYAGQLTPLIWRSPRNTGLLFEDDTTVIHNANGITGPGKVDLFGFESSTTALDEDGNSIPGPPTAVDCCCSFGLYDRSGVALSYE